MKTVYQTPTPSIKIFRPDYNSPTYSAILVMEFEPKKEQVQSLTSSSLISYSFRESTKGLDGPFSFDVTPVEDSDGLTWFDKIQKMDLVMIKEAGKYRYFGAIHSRRYTARMTESGPSRSITFEGDSIGNLLHRFQLIFDTKLWDTTYAETESKILTDKINDKTVTIKAVLTATYEAYMYLTARFNNTNIGVRSVLDNFISFDKCDSINFSYFIESSFYQQGVNTLPDIWQNYLPSPVYELFGFFNPATEKYEVTARECPFDDDVFMNLPEYIIDPVQVVDYDCTESDNEAYTVFFSYLVGDANDPQFYLATGGLDASLVKADLEKFNIYGYRPLVATFRFYSKKNLKGDTDKLEQMKIKLNGRLKEWYQNLPDMLMGTVTLKTDWSGTCYPQIGCRLGWIGAQFYIQEIEHNWSYGQSPTTKLTVIRGYQHKGSSKGKIKNVGKALKEFESQPSNQNLSNRPVDYGSGVI